jgi:hypothetical protein
VRHYTLSDIDLAALPPSSDTAAEAPETMARWLAQLPAPPEQPRTVDRMLGIDRRVTAPVVSDSQWSASPSGQRLPVVSVSQWSASPSGQRIIVAKSQAHSV